MVTFIPGRAGHLGSARPYDPASLQRSVAALTGTQTAYDSITATANPAGAAIYYGYTNGLYANVDAVKAAFPNAIVLGISVIPTEAADELDCEPGNCQPSDCPTFWKAARAAGIEIPAIYCPASWTAEVRTALASVTTSTDQYFLRSAHYGLGPHICGACGYPGADDTQYTDVGTYDISLVGARHVAYLNPTPTPPPPPPVQEDSMISTLFTANGNLHVAEVATDGTLYDHYHRPATDGNKWHTNKVATGCDPTVAPTYAQTPGNTGINLCAALQAGGFIWSYSHPNAAWSPPVTVTP